MKNFSSVFDKYFFLFLFFFNISNSFCFASDKPFISPNNWGSTGLLEIPTARVLEENTYRIGISQIHPYRYYYGAISPLKGLEIAGRLTEILGVKVKKPGWEGYGNYKDKSIEIKYQLFPETKWLPAIAIGIADPYGTRLYASQYIVFSKQIYPFDFTIGMGNGRFGKKPLPSSGDSVRIEMFQNPKEWIKESQIFWGIQMALSNKLFLMFEYNPIKYHKQFKDPAQEKYFKEPVPSSYNFGLRWKPFKWMEIDLTYQRGNRIGINFLTTFNIGNPLIPIYDHFYKEKPADKKLSLEDRITKILGNSGFSNIGVIVINDEIWIELHNDKYYYTPKAFEVVLKLISNVLPDTIKKIHITFKEEGIPILSYTFLKEDLDSFVKKKLSKEEFYQLVNLDTQVTKIYSLKTKLKNFTYGFKPSLETFLNDPSGFFKYRFGLAAWINYHLWRGGSLILSLKGYPLNNISSLNKPLSIPVRSDIVKYIQKDITLERLMFEQIFKSPHEIYTKLALGMLETQYGGIDVEIAKPFWDGRILFGLGSSIVKKRDPDNPLSFKIDDVKDYYTTAFLNLRTNFPEQDISVDLKLGKFLAGDEGLKITISKFIKGVRVFFWYSFTDTSIFKDKFNRDYHDKGIGIIIPIRLFKGTDSRTSYSYVLSPWTRDVAQDIDHHINLFDFIGRNIKIYLDKDKNW